MLVAAILSACLNPARFSAEYMAENDGTFSVEIPEVQELRHVVFALTEGGTRDSVLINHQSEYYHEVIEHFKRYKNEPIVAQLNAELLKGRYAYLKMDACGFKFENDNELIQVEAYSRLNWGAKNRIKKYISQLGDFAAKSDFRAFYANHSSYYQRQMSLFNAQVDIQKQWQWLENSFQLKYNHYRITFSPLAYGNHCTNSFRKRHFKQTVMFVSGPYQKSNYNSQVTSGLMSRVLFTELNHNYVNPESDNYKECINEAFGINGNWAAEAALKFYSTPYMIFNEYMTWSIFCLYAKDTFEEEDFKVINDITERQMMQRGFPRFSAFNKKLDELYAARLKDETVADLYPKILNWAKT
jgi:hypothetical protein